MNATYLAWLEGSTRLSSAWSGKPIHGMIIDHASTQRSAYTRSSSENARSSSSTSKVFGLATCPSTFTVHGRGLRLAASRAGSSLLTPNS